MTTDSFKKRIRLSQFDIKSINWISPWGGLVVTISGSNSLAQAAHTRAQSRDVAVVKRRAASVRDAAPVCVATSATKARAREG